MSEILFPDADLSNADWPKRTPDTFEDLDLSDDDILATEPEEDDDE